MKPNDIDIILSDTLKSNELPPPGLIDKIKSTADSENMSNQKHGVKRLSRVLIAAVASGLIIGATVTAVATNFFGLRDMTLPGPDAPDAYDTPVGTIAAPPVQLVTLQGFPGSPEHAAAVEWQEYYNTLDINLILEVYGDSWHMPEEYWNYGAYSPEMVYKIHEILEKYDLALFGRMMLEVETPELYLDSIAKGPIFTDSSINYYGYKYESGTFQFDSNYGGVGFQFRASRKGVFDNVFLNITDLNDYTEWSYTNAFGTQLFLMQSAYKSLILSDTDDFFIAVNIMAGAETGQWSPAFSSNDLEKFADLIDLGQIRTDLPELKRPEKPDAGELTSPEEWAAAQARFDAFDEAVVPFVGMWKHVRTEINNESGIAIFENELLVVTDNGYTLLWTGEGVEKFFETLTRQIAPGARGIAHRMFINDAGELDIMHAGMFGYTDLDYTGAIHPDTFWWENPLYIEYDPVSGLVQFTDWLGDRYFFERAD